MTAFRTILGVFLLLSPAALAQEGPKGDTVTVSLSAGVPGKTDHLGYSRPRRIAVETTAPRFIFDLPKLHASDPIFLRVTLGETKGTPFYAALDRSVAGNYHDRLYIDKNRDLDLTNDGGPIEGRTSALVGRQSDLVEFLNVTLPLPYSIDGKQFTEPYPCVFYFFSRGGKAPESVEVERDGWRQGRVQVGGKAYLVVLIDDDSNGEYTTGDSWAMRPANTDLSKLLERDAPRSMLFPVWSDDQKETAEVVSVDPAGRSLSLRIHDAKESEHDFFLRVAREQQTPEERRLKIDPLRPKADPGKRIEWLEGKPLKRALEIAQKFKKRVLVEFWGPRCQWCARMAAYTFRDREVVALSKRFICSRLLYRAGVDPAKRYGVEGTPTYVVLDPDGTEITRQSGFSRPTDFAAWLQSALK